MAEVQDIRREIRRLSFRLYFLVYRQAARRVLDLFRFGDGTAERLAAAMVIGALFFLVILLVSILTAAPVALGLGIGATALLVAWATSAVFVFGNPDDVVAQEIDQTRDLLEERRREAELLTEEAKQEDEQGDEEVRVAERPGHRKRSELRATRCPFCDEVIPARALKCKHCGEIVDEDLRRERSRASRRQNFYPLAAFLSWVFPGLGQIYKGQVGRGLLWMVAVVAGLSCCVAPGVVIAVLGIFDAAIYSEG